MLVRARGFAMRIKHCEPLKEWRSYQSDWYMLAIEF